MKPIPAILKGILISNGVAFIILLLTAWIANRNDGAGVVFIMSDFIVVPILMGLSSAYCWKNLKLSIAKTIGWKFPSINMEACSFITTAKKSAIFTATDLSISCIPFH